MIQISFSIVGTGNMAWFLAEKLCAAGHHFEGIYGRNIVAAHEIAVQYPTTLYSTLDEIPDQVNHICFLAVRDDAIAEVAGQVKFAATLLAHTAGSVSAKILANAALHYGLIWPVYSITRSRHFLKDNIPLVTEGNNTASGTLIASVARSVSKLFVSLSEEQRFHLHMAAVFANNFTNHILALAENICAEQHISFDYLRPLMEQTFERISLLPAKEQQTGPAIRKDDTTIHRHLEFLKDQKEAAEVYKSLSISIRKMYENRDH